LHCKFQSPQSGLCLCNRSPSGQFAAYPTFQSPQSGLCLCNRRGTSRFLPIRRHFSPLSRGYASAMPPSSLVLKRESRKFQSPQSGLCLCNMREYTLPCSSM